MGKWKRRKIVLQKEPSVEQNHEGREWVALGLCRCSCQKQQTLQDHVSKREGLPTLSMNILYQWFPSLYFQPWPHLWTLGLFYLILGHHTAMSIWTCPKLNFWAPIPLPFCLFSSALSNPPISFSRCLSQRNPRSYLAPSASLSFLPNSLSPSQSQVAFSRPYPTPWHCTLCLGKVSGFLTLPSTATLAHYPHRNQSDHFNIRHITFRLKPFSGFYFLLE